MTAPDSSQLWLQIIWLFVLALPIATISWTVTHEEIFREAREYLRFEEPDLPRPGQAQILLRLHL